MTDKLKGKLVLKDIVSTHEKELLIAYNREVVEVKDILDHGGEKLVKIDSPVRTPCGHFATDELSLFSLKRLFVRIGEGIDIIVRGEFWINIDVSEIQENNQEYEFEIERGEYNEVVAVLK